MTYRLRKVRECPVCLNLMEECECTNRYLKRQSVHIMGKVFKYEPGNPDMPENRLIFRLKQANSRAVTDFAADELAPVVKRLVGDHPEKYVLVGVPRSHSAIRKYGYDHVRELCRALTKRTGIPYMPAVVRKGSKGQQKEKNRQERIEAAETSYGPAKRFRLKGKRVILVDDIITTGASVGACAHAVRKCGARTVLCVCLGAHHKFQEIFDQH